MSTKPLIPAPRQAHHTCRWPITGQYDTTCPACMALANIQRGGSR